MKLNTFLSTALIATVAALSFGAQAADADKAPAEQTEKAAPKKVKPHSHMTEKTGVPAPAPEATADKPAPAKDAKRHNHQRDAK
ncbi:MAG: hypothetical protein JSR83_00345 [Proteobacteria bacterium]|nr:hypothetical protein [Pseudomonadota bacterium]